MKSNQNKHQMLPVLVLKLIFTSVAEPELEPEPVEQQIFAGAGSGSGAGYVNSSKMLQNPKFFILKVEIYFKNLNFVAIFLKSLLIIIYVFKKHENC
jgi:hypothetical protein